MSMLECWDLFEHVYKIELRGKILLCTKSTAFACVWRHQLADPVQKKIYSHLDYRCVWGHPYSITKLLIMSPICILRSALNDALNRTLFRYWTQSCLSSYSLLYMQKLVNAKLEEFFGTQSGARKSLLLVSDRVANPEERCPRIFIECQDISPVHFTWIASDEKSACSPALATGKECRPVFGHSSNSSKIMSLSAGVCVYKMHGFTASSQRSSTWAIVRQSDISIIELLLLIILLFHVMQHDVAYSAANCCYHSWQSVLRIVWIPWNWPDFAVST